MNIKLTSPSEALALLPICLELCFWLTRCSQVQYVDCMNKKASFSSVNPKLLSWFLMDPKVAQGIFSGPYAPTQFQLIGSGKLNRAKRLFNPPPKKSIKAPKTRDLPQMSH